MRHLAILTAILSITICAKASNYISVNGVIGPDEVTIDVNDSLSIGIINDIHAIEGQGTYFLGIASGDFAHYEIISPIFPYPFETQDIWWVNEPDIASGLGIYNPFIGVTAEGLPPFPPTLQENRIVDGILLNCDWTGDVTLKLYDEAFVLLDTQLVHQVPEPATIMLLGLGALILKRRK
jgi:hypothetical protein